MHTICQSTEYGGGIYTSAKIIGLGSGDKGIYNPTKSGRFSMLIHRYHAVPINYHLLLIYLILFDVIQVRGHHYIS